MTIAEPAAIVSIPTTSDDELTHITCLDESDGTRISLCGIDMTHDQPADVEANCIVCDNLEHSNSRFCPKKAVCDCVEHH